MEEFEWSNRMQTFSKTETKIKFNLSFDVQKTFWLFYILCHIGNISSRPNIYFRQSIIRGFFRLRYIRFDQIGYHKCY